MLTAADLLESLDPARASAPVMVEWGRSRDDIGIIAVMLAVREPPVVGRGRFSLLLVASEEAGAADDITMCGGRLHTAVTELLRVHGGDPLWVEVCEEGDLDRRRQPRRVVLSADPGRAMSVLVIMGDE